MIKFEVLTNGSKLDVDVPFYWNDEDDIFEYYYTHELFPIVKEEYDEQITIIPKHAIQAIFITKIEEEK